MPIYKQHRFHSPEGHMPQVEHGQHGGVDGMEILAYLFLR